MESLKSVNNIIIYSTGLLGGSIGLALKNSGWKGRITGLSSEKNIGRALDLGCIDEGFGYEKLPEIIGSCDMLFLCSPIKVIIETLDRLSGLNLPEGMIISDIGSTKKAITEHAAEILPKKVSFIGGHPMAGSEKSGPGSADPYMFQNAVYAITQCRNGEEKLANDFSEFLESYLGCKSVIIDAETHDYIAAAISHVPQLLSVMLVNLAGRVEDDVPGTLQLAAGGFRDMTRIASSPYSMWKDI
ncbi:MAG: prephenate dehydrogenase, partial [Chitinivibrionales bacterium]